MAVVVSDTSPIRALHQLDLLGVLSSLFAEVVVPPAVVRELLAEPRQGRRLEMSHLGFCVFRAPSDASLVQQFRLRLDPGEAEAIALALEIHANGVLIDEDAGRRFAKAQGLVPIGALAVLIRAKAAGRIEAVAPLMDRLEREIMFRISDVVRRTVLEQAGELAG